ncbi:hypothetical protein ACJJTC_006355 [Scirpophaga incertulas]
MMSGLQRTPTKTRLSSSDNAEATVSIPAVSRSGLSMQHCDSAPDLTTLTASIADRKKRKYEGDDINIADVIEEMFSRFSMEQEKRFRKVQDTVSVINSQNADLQKSVELLSNKYDDFLTKISMLESGRQEDRKTIRQLEEKLESLERKSRSAGVEIRNLPKDAEIYRRVKDSCFVGHQTELCIYGRMKVRHKFVSTVSQI